MSPASFVTSCTTGLGPERPPPPDGQRWQPPAAHSGVYGPAPRCTFPPRDARRVLRSSRPTPFHQEQAWVHGLPKRPLAPPRYLPWPAGWSWRPLDVSPPTG